MPTPIEIKRDPRGQGERGEQLAAAWFIDREIEVFVPLLHTPRDFDFIVRVGRGAQASAGQTRGGNQSWSGVVKRLDGSKYDYLFVHVADGRRWFIPSTAITCGCSVRVGGPKYAEWELDRGLPLAIPGTPLDSPGPWRGSRAVKGDGL
jgi:hypothetical protein